MIPSDVAIGRFRELWREHYGEELNEEDAHAYAMSILEIGEIMYGSQARAKERAPP